MDERQKRKGTPMTPPKRHKSSVWAALTAGCLVLFAPAAAAGSMGATFMITSQPTGATVIYNGQPAGQTELRLVEEDTYGSTPLEITIVHQDMRLPTTISYLRVGDKVKIHGDFSDTPEIRFGETLAGHLLYLYLRVKNGEQQAEKVFAGLTEKQKAELAGELETSPLAKNLRSGACYAEKRYIAQAIQQIKSRLGQLSWKNCYVVQALEFLYGNTSEECWLGQLEDGRFLEFVNSYKTVSDRFGAGDWLQIYIPSDIVSLSGCLYRECRPEDNLADKYGITRCFHARRVVKIEKRTGEKQETP
ncbi:MAG: hypothetical protein ACLFPI_11570 [Desulfobacterales bacterium]